MKIKAIEYKRTEIKIIKIDNYYCEKCNKYLWHKTRIGTKPSFCCYCGYELIWGSV